MRSLALAALLLASASALATGLAQDPDAIRLDLHTRIGDSAPVSVQVAVPLGTSTRAAAAGSLTYNIEISKSRDGMPLAKVSLDDASGNPLRRTLHGWPVKSGATLSVAFTVCGERVIEQEPAPAVIASCASLQPMAAVDPMPDSANCGECYGAYEGMPQHIEARTRIAPLKEPGERLVLSGRTLAPDGSPRPGVVVYVFQTDKTGHYPPPDIPRSTISQSQGRLRGWARTDAQGRYTFGTIRPGLYPDRSEPAHIHMVVIEPGCAAYFLEDIHFSDDPTMAKLRPALRKWFLTGVGGSGIVTPKRDAASGVLYATRDIHLGEKFKNYPGCGKPG